VDVEVERQNRDLLKSMNKRATKSGPGRAVSDQIGGEASGNRGEVKQDNA
jgi:hypothetical protein